MEIGEKNRILADKTLFPLNCAFYTTQFFINILNNLSRLSNTVKLNTILFSLLVLSLAPINIEQISIKYLINIKIPFISYN